MSEYSYQVFLPEQLRSNGTPICFEGVDRFEICRNSECPVGRVRRRCLFATDSTVFDDTELPTDEVK